MFIQYGIVDLIFEHLKDDLESSLFQLSVSGLAAISENTDAIKMIEEDVRFIELMFEIVVDSKNTLNWPMRIDAAACIFLMITQSELLLLHFIENKKWVKLIFLRIIPK